MNNEGRDISEDLSRPSLFIKNDNYFIDIFRYFLRAAGHGANHYTT